MVLTMRTTLSGVSSLVRTCIADGGDVTHTHTSSTTFGDYSRGVSIHPALTRNPRAVLPNPSTCCSALFSKTRTKGCMTRRCSMPSHMQLPNHTGLQRSHPQRSSCCFLGHSRAWASCLLHPLCWQPPQLAMQPPRCSTPIAAVRLLHTPVQSPPPCIAPSCSLAALLQLCTHSVQPTPLSVRVNTVLMI